MKTIVGLGEALWDCLPEGRKFGGAPTNFAYHCHQFGHDSWAVSAVGHDALGREILDLCAGKRLSCIIPQVDKPTGTVQVTLDEKGIPCYDISRDVAWDHIPFTEELELLAMRTDAVCWGSLAQRSAVSRNTIHRFVDSLSDTALKVFDVNLRQDFYNMEILQHSLEQCDILKINDEELVLMTRLFGYLPAGLPTTVSLRDFDFQPLCQHLLRAFDLRMLVLTCGVDGSYVFTAQSDTSFLTTPRVTVADTVGAGDSFTAAFVSTLLEGGDVPLAHERAVRVSAFVCTQHGAMPDMSTVRW